MAASPTPPAAKGTITRNRRQILTAANWDHHAEKALGESGRTTLHCVCPRGGKAFNTPRVELARDVKISARASFGDENPDRGDIDWCWARAVCMCAKDRADEPAWREDDMVNPGLIVGPLP